MATLTRNNSDPALSSRLRSDNAIVMYEDDGLRTMARTRSQEHLIDHRKFSGQAKGNKSKQTFDAFDKLHGKFRSASDRASNCSSPSVGNRVRTPTPKLDFPVCNWFGVPCLTYALLQSASGSPSPMASAARKMSEMSLNPFKRLGSGSGSSSGSNSPNRGMVDLKKSILGSSSGRSTPNKVIQVDLESRDIVASN
mmetsp:Transcript_36498/g.57009  ORF Transcript_36498/g.57009 Transcript_36498/m.57009 type:complete len:196 (+) Transcript_36498:291-878(+)